MKARFRHEPARAGGVNQRCVVLVGGREEDRQLGPGAPEQFADLDAVIIAKTHVQENAIRRVTLDGVQRSRSAPSLTDDLISACGQEHPDGGAERRLVVDDYDARTIAVGGVRWHRAMD